MSIIPKRTLTVRYLPTYRTYWHGTGIRRKINLVKNKLIVTHQSVPKIGTRYGTGLDLNEKVQLKIYLQVINKISITENLQKTKMDNVKIYLTLLKMAFISAWQTYIYLLSNLENKESIRRQKIAYIKLKTKVPTYGMYEPWLRILIRSDPDLCGRIRILPVRYFGYVKLYKLGKNI